jgi:hypothetical protein
VTRSIAGVWILFLAWSVLILVTYSRLSPHELYHVSGSGLEGGASRVLVFLNFPTALVAAAIIALTAERLTRRWATVLAVAGVVLCAAVVWPGVVDQADLDAKPVNALAALGVLVAAALTIPTVATARGEQASQGHPADPVRLAVAIVVVILAIPWIGADLGFSFNGVPVLGTLYQTGELRTQPGDPAPHPAVHHGHHHGMDGVLLVLSALLLSRVLPTVRRTWLRAVVGAYLALMLAYGLGEIANDFWLEQVVKRGWTDWEIPDVTRPGLTVAWGVVVLGAALIFTAGAWRASRPLRSSSTGPPAQATESAASTSSP